MTRAISLVGGYDCAWTFTGARPKIAPATGVALEVRDARGVTVEDLEIVGASDESVPGDTAIAAFVVNGEALFRNMTIAALEGRPAAFDAKLVANWSGSVAATGGRYTMLDAGAEPADCVPCLDGTSSSSGRGASVGGSPESGRASPVVGGMNAGVSGVDTCSDGSDGAAGSAAGAGSNTVVLPSYLDETGWHHPSRATEGKRGKPGQGGGGGGAIAASDRGGGSGGCGGCGGGWGEPGTNGGSSFAVLAYRSTLSMDSCTIQSSAVLRSPGQRH